MLIAVEGCCHGELDSIYASIEQTEIKHGVKVDVLLICGDFQAVRNAADLATMACPQKYRAMHDFYKYYTGEKAAPVLTIVIGGNHEASNHLWELYYGGWLAPNIYYLGYAGVVTVGGVRIGGLSGIYNRKHYHLGHYEKPPYSDDDMRSTYHIRELEVFRLLQLRKPLDIMLSHDWPQHIARSGNLQMLYRRKEFLRDEINNGSLGSPPAALLLSKLKPKYWFAAHLHVKYAAVVKHDDEHATRFLSLDKCLPGRHFLQLVQFDGDGTEAKLKYDLEWLAVLRSTAALFSAHRGRVSLDPTSTTRDTGRNDLVPTSDEIDKVRELLGGDDTVPLNFSESAEAYKEGQKIVAPQPAFTEHPQTETFVKVLELPSAFRTQVRSEVKPVTSTAAAPAAATGADAPPAVDSMFTPAPLDEEIDLGDD